MDRLKLLPCPFCGEPPREHYGEHSEEHWVSCDSEICDICPTTSGGSIESARRAWNSRHSLSQEAMRDEALENVALVRRLLRHEALLSLMIENSVAVEGGIVAIKRELYEELRDLNNAPSILRALKREPNAAGQELRAGEGSLSVRNAGVGDQSPAPAAPDVADIHKHRRAGDHWEASHAHARLPVPSLAKLGRGWVPVSERLPEGDDPVLTLSVNAHMTTKPAMAMRNSISESIKHGRVPHYTHWMPLPPPPERP